MDKIEMDNLIEQAVKFFVNCDAESIKEIFKDCKSVQEINKMARILYNEL